jgi:delta24-sterol reductase
MFVFNKQVVEFIPTKDFYHRHNRGWFWLMEHTISFANHPVFR